jgi:hypothetical protein
MASFPAESADFNFGPERIYSPQLVAEKVMWPLVAGVWGGDWLKDSEDGFELVFPKKGVHSGRLLSVQIDADYDEFNDIYGEKSGIHSATLSVEETASGDRSKFLLRAAKTAMENYIEDEDHDDEDNGLFLWPEGDEDDFVIIEGVMYSFDTDGDWYTELYRGIKGPEQRLNLPTASAAEDISGQRKLYSHDLETIETGCLVLKASNTIMKAIEEIKAAPILLD